MSEDIWLGRVFGKDGYGGNHTAVVLQDHPSPAVAARTLGFPDSAFVTHRAEREASVRTFSPHEELAQCLQAALATPVALGAQNGQTWRVRQPAGELLINAEREIHGWRCWAQEQHGGAHSPEPVDDLPTWFAALRPRFVARMHQGRSRLYAALDRVDELVPPDPADLRKVCTAHRCSGVVFYDTAAPDRVRARVFPASLAYREDSATGGAAAGIAAILRQQGRTGIVPVLQGPTEEARQGHLLMRIGDTVHVGGRVQPLLTGRTAFE